MRLKVSDKRPAEPDLLKRLRRAIRLSGLAAGISPYQMPSQAILVNSALFQTTIKYLESLDRATAHNLALELQALASSEEHELLMEGRGYTFFHVIHFLYEYAKHYAGIPDNRSFCVGVGLYGGGLQIDLNTDIISLIRLVVTALPPSQDRHNVGLLVQKLSPAMLEKIYVTDIFNVEIFPEQQDRLRIILKFTHRDQVEDALKEFGLEQDTGSLFLNSALQIQGTIELGLRLFAENAQQDTEMTVRIEDRDERGWKEIERDCSCTWTLTWKPDIQLRRLTHQDRILGQADKIYEAMHRLHMAEHELMEEQRKRIKMQQQMIQEMEQELRTAHKLQMGLMPKKHPQIEGFDIAGRCIPANHVGGDYFQYFYQDGKLAIGLADVTGHAMEAAIPAVMFSGILKSRMDLGGTLQERFEQLNRSLYGALPGRAFICFMMGELDLTTRTFSLSDSGCPYPYCFRAATGELVEVPIDAYPLGIRHDTVYVVAETQLHPGDRAVFCSDGIAEAVNASGGQFGYDRTAETIRKACEEGLSAEATIGRIIEEVNAFRGDAPQSDDMTCVVVRVKRERCEKEPKTAKPLPPVLPQPGEG